MPPPPPLLPPSQTADTHIFSAAAPTDFLSATATGDGVHLIVSAESTQSAARSRLLAAKLEGLPRSPATGALNLTAYDLRRGAAASPFPWTPLPTHGGYEFRYVAGYNSSLYFLTTWNAPRYRVVRIDVPPAPAPVGDYVQVVPEHAKDLLQAVAPTLGPAGARALVLTYLHDVKGVLRVVDAADGAPIADVPLPGPGSVSASTDRDSSELFFKFSSFTNPGSVFRWDAATPGTPPTLWKTSVVRGVDLAAFETTQVFVPSRDGRANVPLFITAPVNLTRDGTAPTVLYGYGGFNIVNSVEFQPDVLVAGAAYGAVYASCNMRGGGEYGERWHADGIVANKQNTYDDFVACAEYLVAANITSPGRLSIHGGSFGGTLVAVAANQRPDLFGCVLSDVPVTDIARFHKFTVGVFWKSDYGDPDAAADRPLLMAWSPLHNIRAPTGGTRNYPAILVSTAEFDDRVPPLHSLKYAATLQHDLASSPDAPQRNALLLRVETQAGHGSGKPMSKHIADAADKWSFCMSAVGAKWTGADPASLAATAAPQREEDAVAQAAAAVVGADGISLLG
jgi:prolyl oligopeptidase